MLHYNINSILAEGRLEELGIVCSTLNIGVLICTESKLSQTIPNNLLQITGYHETIHHNRNRFRGGCIIYISNSLTLNIKHNFNQINLSIFGLMSTQKIIFMLIMPCIDPQLKPLSTIWNFWKKLRLF